MQITIARRFRGPPDSANGGYACGLLGKHVHGAAQVRLHRPPPLDEPLTLDLGAHDHITLHKREHIIAEGVRTALAHHVPEAVNYDVAAEATRNFRWYHGHPFAGCFVCGPERQPGDGLCIYPGAVTNRDVVAAPWVPDVTICDSEDQAVLPEVLWAALDCPSWFGLLEFEAGITGALLGQLSAHVLRRPKLAEKCVVIGWSRGREGRKLYGGAAVYTADGELLGSSYAIWIELKAMGRSAE
ncbi:MAG TPA: hypothetical protein VFZ04_08590 [Longimicrobiales bacterium]